MERLLEDLVRELFSVSPTGQPVANCRVGVVFDKNHDESYEEFSTTSNEGVFKVNFNYKLSAIDYKLQSVYCRYILDSREKFDDKPIQFELKQLDTPPSSSR
ncbi:MAG: hypothetical protein S4CHLAM81_07430 [Chlamydiales bacterium]|nr:hypothetical protein [Chlamydiales bacterium]MCH9635526.1 hypothetical protein [Chlamydiales bacterium]MCH9703735.1 hypothetical protein [Chlamydiota bacterium]